jgi:hypothetical protein
MVAVALADLRDGVHGFFAAIKALGYFHQTDER